MFRTYKHVNKLTTQDTLVHIHLIKIGSSAASSWSGKRATEAVNKR